MSAITTESPGVTLLKALLGEIRQLQKPWEQTPEREQEVVIDRLRRAVEHTIRQTTLRIAAGNFQRVPVEIESVTFKDGVKAVMQIERSAEGVHALADGTGGRALVVLASIDQFIEGMNRILADADQPDLFDDEQTQSPATDQSWQQLIDSLELPPPGEGEEPGPVKTMGRQAYEFLQAVNCDVPIEVCEAWTEQECTAAAYWAIEYAKNPETAPARPHWLPIPEAPAPEADSDDEEPEVDDEQPE